MSSVWKSQPQTSPSKTSQLPPHKTLGFFPTTTRVQNPPGVSEPVCMHRAGCQRPPVTLQNHELAELLAPYLQHRAAVFAARTCTALQAAVAASLDERLDRHARRGAQPDPTLKCPMCKAVGALARVSRSTGGQCCCCKSCKYPFFIM